ncbi:MAG: hypothetical protein SF051_11985, partial [Elusimicrobiota bacterium]|nr:hypothetical protein [Elusimicrobiota bacterium]
AAGVVALCALPRLLDAPRLGLALGGGLSPRLASLTVGWRDLLILPPHHALRALGVAPAAAGWPESAAGYLGPVFAGLAAWGLLASRGRPGRATLAALLAVFALLSAARWPLAGVPVLSFLRVPARFMFATSLLAAVAAAWGWEDLARRLAPAPRRAAWAAAAAALFLGVNPAFQAPMVVWGEPTPWLETLAAAPPGAVIDLPLELMPGMGGSGDNGLAYLRATRHGKPLFNGHLSVPGEAAQALARDADLQALVACQEGRCDAVDDALWKRLHGRLGARYVIRSSLVSAPLDAALRRSRALRPLAPGAADAFAIAPEAP